MLDARAKSTIVLDEHSGQGTWVVAILSGLVGVKVKSRVMVLAWVQQLAPRCLTLTSHASGSEAVHRDFPTTFTETSLSPCLSPTA